MFKAGQRVECARGHPWPGGGGPTAGEICTVTATKEGGTAYGQGWQYLELAEYADEDCRYISDNFREVM